MYWDTKLYKLVSILLASIILFPAIVLAKNVDPFLLTKELNFKNRTELRHFIDNIPYRYNYNSAKAKLRDEEFYRKIENIYNKIEKLSMEDFNLKSKPAKEEDWGIMGSSPKMVAKSILKLKDRSEKYLNARKSLLLKEKYKNNMIEKKGPENYKLLKTFLGIQYKFRNLKVLRVFKDSNVYKAGLRQNDKIVSLNKTTYSGIEFGAQIRDIIPGEKVELGYKRNGKYHSIEFTAEPKEITAFFKNNLDIPDLKEKEVHNKSFAFKNTLGYDYGKHYIIYANLVIFTNRVIEKKMRAESAAYSVINVFKYLHSKSKEFVGPTNQNIHLYNYILLNQNFYGFLETKLKEVLKNLKFKNDSDINFIKFSSILINEYYKRNYDNFNKVHHYSKKTRATLKEYNQYRIQRAKKIQQRYKDREGWKNLKWGMTVKEVKFLLHNNDNELNKTDWNSVLILADKILESDAIKCFNDSKGSLYFYNDKLFAREITFSNVFYFFDNNKKIIDTLKNKFPNGSVTMDSWESRNVRNFWFKNSKIKIFTYAHIGGMLNNAGIMYLCPYILNKIPGELGAGVHFK